MKRFLSILTIFILIFSTKVLGIVYEEKEMYHNFEFENDMESTGVACSKIFSFNIDKTWKVNDGYLDLIFTQSELLQEEQSTMTIFINDVPIHSMMLKDKENYKEELKIPFPLDKLKEGYNEVKIKTHRRITDMICQDEFNSANWIVFHKESYVHLDFYDRKDNNSLKEFPYPYMTGHDSRSRVNFLISDKAENDEISASLEVMSYFGHFDKRRSLDFNLNKISESENLDDTNLIYIGKLDNTDENIKQLLDEEQSTLVGDKAVIKEVESPYNPEHKILIVISNNGEMLKKAAKFITNKNLMSEVKSNWYVVDETIDVKDEFKGANNKIYFKDLGYDGITLEGPFKQECNFEINIPQNKVIQEDGKVVINMRYSKNLDFENSLVTLYINDEPIGSKKLVEDEANNDKLEISIPKTLENKSYYNLKVKFDLEMYENICDPRASDMPWAYVSEESYFYATYTKRGDFKFENYPYPFVADKKLNDVGIVISDNLTKNELNLTGNIVSYMGYFIENNSGDIDVLRCSELNNDFKNKNLIVIGTALENSIIKDLNKNIYLKYSDDSQRFESNDKLKIIKEYSQEIAALEFIKSPYKEENGIMLVTSPNKENLVLASRYLNDLKLTKTLKGDVITIDNDEKINMINYDSSIKEKIEDNDKTTNIGFNITKKIGFFLVFFVISIGLVVTVLVFILKKYKNK